MYACGWYGSERLIKPLVIWEITLELQRLHSLCVICLVASVIIALLPSRTHTQPIVSLDTCIFVNSEARLSALISPFVYLYFFSLQSFWLLIIPSFSPRVLTLVTIARVTWALDTAVLEGSSGHLTQPTYIQCIRLLSDVPISVCIVPAEIFLVPAMIAVSPAYLKLFIFCPAIASMPDKSSTSS